jgi:hypothetical protein
MSPLLTTYANGSAQGYGAFSVAAAAGDFESIATVSVGAGGSSSITFSSISADYAHLQIRGIARSNRSSDLDTLQIRFNGDTGTNYSRHYLYADGSSVSAGADTSTTFANVGLLTGANAGSSMFGANIIDILDYANTNKFKTIRCLSGEDRNGSGDLQFASGLWRNTNAITSITIISQAGVSTMQQYSHFALYGIKSA